ncbi:relaxase/mobilization nuclease domain-containing protein [Pedobacter agri]|uniref:relaxase/mobilization nuclease domain-containing protein n=1 Tax=Pedobacter agri TaxID=454586 RepID=UPI0029305C9A|nr:relaxase/mobilization nuclease domain-containing protein [Pedobacter agri]
MVTRILSGKSIRGLLNYNENKVKTGDAELILANKFGAEIGDLELRDKLRRFEQLTILNSRAKSNAIHIMLNFDRQDKLCAEKLQHIAVDYMERIGFGEQPFLVYEHKDVSHPHIHIITTNVQQNGDRISIHNIGIEKDEKIRIALQMEYGLVKAESRTKDPLIKGISVRPAQYGEKPTRESIYNIVTAVLRDYKFTSLAEYNAVLSEFNVTADRGAEGSRMYERRGLVYAILDKNGNRVGVPIKASSLAGKPILARVEAKFKGNKLKRKQHISSIRKKLDDALAGHKILSRKDFSSVLRKENIGVIFRKNDTGRIYGVTYVDHNSRCVFNGSDLGKSYSAKALLERFGTVRLLESKAASSPVPSTLTKINAEQNHQTIQTAKQTNLMETLLQKPDFDPLSRFGNRKKKKKKKRASAQQDIGNQMR